MCINQTKSAATFLIAKKRKPPKKLKHALWHIRIHEGGSIHYCLKLARTIAHRSNNNIGTSINSQTHKRGTTGGHKVLHKHWEQQKHWHLNKYNTQAQQVGHKVCKSCASHKKSIHMKASKQAYGS